MKKIIAILLSITLLITACSFVVNAAQSEKISSKLQNILNSDGYDTVSVYIFLKDVVNEYVFIFDVKYKYNYPERLEL